MTETTEPEWLGIVIPGFCIMCGAGVLEDECECGEDTRCCLASSPPIILGRRSKLSEPRALAGGSGFPSGGSAGDRPSRKGKIEMSDEQPAVQPLPTHWDRAAWLADRAGLTGIPRGNWIKAAVEILALCHEDGRLAGTIEERVFAREGCAGVE